MSNPYNVHSWNPLGSSVFINCGPNKILKSRWTRVKWKNIQPFFDILTWGLYGLTRSLASGSKNLAVPWWGHSKGIARISPRRGEYAAISPVPFSSRNLTLYIRSSFLWRWNNVKNINIKLESTHSIFIFNHNRCYHRCSSPAWACEDTPDQNHLSNLIRMLKPVLSSSNMSAYRKVMFI